MFCLRYAGPSFYSLPTIISIRMPTPDSQPEFNSQEKFSFKQVMLPSGKTIEMLVFNEETPEILGVCGGEGGCGSGLVYPTRWSEVDEQHWNVTLRCPDCETVTEGVYPQAAVDTFDERLDEGTDALIGDLRRLTRANMTEEGERFFSALAADAILPEDF